TIKHLKDKLEEKYNPYINHLDSYYCFAFVKIAWIFATIFYDHSIIISQDDKSKVSLGILVVERTFKANETINEPVSILDHDFPLGRKMKLILFVYLLINSNNMNNSFHSGYLTIYTRSEYFVGTTALTHMANLISITNSEKYNEIIHIEEKIKPL
ncbi:29668_t:CDS:2, partial [Gigaspora margarita]